MRLAHNMYSMGIYKNYKVTLQAGSKALGNISSGIKLNSAKDNANKIAQSETLKMEILSREAAQSNIQDTNSMLQTFDGALQEINNNISRLETLTVKAANGVNEEEDRQVIQKEIDGILKSLNDLAKNTSFNGMDLTSKKNVSNGSITDPNSPLTKKRSQIGALENETVEIPFFDLTIKGLGLDDIDVKTEDGASKALNKVDKATVIVSRIRSKYGALQSRLEETYSSMSATNEDLLYAQSSLEDADVAEEMLKYTTSQIIYQSSIALMAQSNKFPQEALNILANAR
ncbi:MAG: flagellin [Clostridium butyricum]|nr:flagellin [Clostridium butyricum]